MTLLFLGRGNSFFSPLNNTSCFCIEHEGEYILFDIGIGAYRNFLTLGLNPDRIKAIFISQTHYDHIAGLLEYYNNRRRLFRAMTYIMDPEALNRLVTTFIQERPITEVTRVMPGDTIAIDIGTRTFNIDILKVVHTESSIGFKITIVEANPSFKGFINIRRTLALGVNMREGRWLPQEAFQSSQLRFQKVDYNTESFLIPGNRVTIGLLYDGFTHLAISELMPVDILVIGATWGGQIEPYRSNDHSSVQNIFSELSPHLDSLRCVFLVHLPAVEEDRLEILNQSRSYFQFSMIPSITDRYYIG